MYELNGISLPYQLNAKSKVTVQVCGTPTARGSNNVGLSITGTSNDRTITLNGMVDVRGLEVCGSRTPDIAFSNAIVVNNLSDTEFVDITNCGDVTTSYTLSVNAPEYTVTPTTVGPLAPGASAQAMVVFMPTSRGSKPGTLTITDVAGNVTAMTVALSGEGGCAVPAASQATFEITEAVGKTLPTEFTITITNSGNIAWDPGTPTVTPAGAFAYVNGPGQIAPNGGTGTVTLSFHPPTATTFGATVTFEGAGPCQENTVAINLSGTGVTSSVSESRSADGFVLMQNAPNPVAQGLTSFSYTVPVSAPVRIVLADVTGKVVRELVSGSVAAGTYTVEVQTAGLASGSYHYMLESGATRLVKQLVVAK
jgi:hypothetical protein